MLLSPYHPLQLAWGFIIWSVYFIVLYGGMSVACSAAPPRAEQGPFTWLNVSLLVLTLITGIGLLYAAYRCRVLAAQARPTPDEEIERRGAGSNQLEGVRAFIASLAGWVNLAAGVATLAVGVPVVVYAPCVS